MSHTVSHLKREAGKNTVSHLFQHRAYLANSEWGILDWFVGYNGPIIFSCIWELVNYLFKKLSFNEDLIFWCRKKSISSSDRLLSVMLVSAMLKQYWLRGTRFFELWELIVKPYLRIANYVWNFECEFKMTLTKCIVNSIVRWFFNHL